MSRSEWRWGERDGGYAAVPTSFSGQSLGAAVVVPVAAHARTNRPGRAPEVNFANASTDPPCRERVSTVLMASSYIPAHVGDEAVEAFYLEFVDLSAGRGI